MTLGDFFNICAENPAVLIFYALALPLTALLALMFGRGEGHLSPWKYLYSVLIYLACIPGIFAITLSLYVCLFEQHSFMDTKVYTLILPVVSVIASGRVLR
jgi:hypothetical protein